MNAAAELQPAADPQPAAPQPAAPLQPAAPPQYDIPRQNLPPANAPQEDRNIDERVREEDDDYTRGVKSLLSAALYAITNGVGIAVFCAIMHLAITIGPSVFQVTRAALKMGIYILADALAVVLAVLMLALALFGATWASFEARSHLTALLYTITADIPEEH